MTCVVGASVHYGRAELVAVGLADGRLVLCARRTVALIEGDLPLAPYHHEGLRLPLADVEPLVDAVRACAERLACAALTDLRDEHGVRALALEASPVDALPAVADVLASYRLTCAADGVLYREAIADAGRALGLQVVRVPRGVDAQAWAAERAGWTVDRVTSAVRELGASAGRPWRRDHKQAAASALGLLLQPTILGLLAGDIAVGDDFDAPRPGFEDLGG